MLKSKCICQAYIGFVLGFTTDTCKGPEINNVHSPFFKKSLTVSDNQYNKFEIDGHPDARYVVFTVMEFFLAKMQARAYSPGTKGHRARLLLSHVVFPKPS